MTPLERKFRGVGGGGLIGKTIRGRGGMGMDIFWNHTLYPKMCKSSFLNLRRNDNLQDYLFTCQITNIYTVNSLNRHSLRQTAGFGPCHFSVILL